MAGDLDHILARVRVRRTKHRGRHRVHCAIGMDPLSIMDRVVGCIMERYLTAKERVAHRERVRSAHTDDSYTSDARWRGQRADHIAGWLSLCRHLTNVVTCPEPIEFHLPDVTSTNDYAKELLGTYPYVLVTARHQTRGRGRKGRAWEGESGVNVYCSIGLRHGQDVSMEEAASFMARGALAVLDALRGRCPGVSFRMKYPNDIHAKTPAGWAKISGILVEHEYLGQRLQTTVVGIGVNVAQTTFAETITQPCTSLALLGVHADVTDIVQRIKHAFSENRQRTSREIYGRWNEELCASAVWVRVAGEEGRWMIVRVADDGRLVIRHEVSHTERMVSDGDTLRYED